MVQDTVVDETKDSTCAGAVPTTNPPPATPGGTTESIEQVQNQCNNFLLDLNSGQRVTEASPEQRVGTTLCKMRDLNTLLSRLIIALDRQIVSAASDTLKLQHLMRLQQQTNVDELQEAARVAQEVADSVLKPSESETKSSKGDVDDDHSTADDADDDDASGSGDAGEHVPPS